MSAEMINLLWLLGATLIIVLVMIFLFGNKFIKFFIEENIDDENSRQKPVSEKMVEMATLVRKCDDRMRIVEASGKVKYIDEYYELEFITRKGKKLKIECSQKAYDAVPFNQEGSLTYKRNNLVKFKYYDGIVYN
ncbi:MAG: DUF2500 family protein [Ruminococcus sp.]|nr:DUF2500 family protein [Ruminococcus sp.]